MSWSNTYTHTIALAIDRFGAALIFNEPDITISSLCWVVRRGSKMQQDALKLAPWQRKLLQLIGNGLEHFWPGHCARARGGDLATSSRARSLLTVMVDG